MTTLINDIKYGIRQLIKTPVFSLIAIGSLALGIGANTAIFSLMNSVSLRSLPVESPQELVYFKWESAGTNCWHRNSWISRNEQKVFGSDAFRYTDYTHLRDNLISVPNLTAMGRLSNIRVNVQGNLNQAEGLLVCGSWFDTLGIQTQVGRTINTHDDQPEADFVSVISHDCWQHTFSGRTDVVGQTVQLDNRSLQVIGVLPKGFWGPYPGTRIDYYVPASIQKAVRPNYVYGYEIMARIPPQANMQRIQSEFELSLNQFVNARTAPGRQKPIKAFIASGSHGILRYGAHLSKPLPMLMGIVAVVLLLACANLAGLLLARGATRQYEFSLRQALGAKRWDLMRQLLIEVALLTWAGVLAGLALSTVSKAAIAKMIWKSHITLSLQNDWRVLGFAVALSIVTLLLFGLLPALQSTKTKPVIGLRQKTFDGFFHARLGKTLVSVQVGLCLFLLTGAGLLVQTLVNLNRSELGFNADNVLAFNINPKPAGYEKQHIMEFHHKVALAVAALPGVQSMTCAKRNLIGEGTSSMSARNLLLPNATEPQRFRYNFKVVGNSFLKTMEIPLLLGRAFDDSDTVPGAKTVILNASLARELFGDENPIGKQFPADMEYRIIGVCQDFKVDDIKKGHQSYALFSIYQKPKYISSLTYLLRTTSPPHALIPAVRQAVAALDKNVSIEKIKSESKVISDQSKQERLFAVLASGFSALAILLSCIGLYGLLSFQITRRRREIGVRMALGATPKQVVYPLLRSASTMAFFGVIIGIPAILAAKKLISSHRWGIKTHDPTTLLGAVFVLYIVLLAAAYIPARRAAKIDPMEALRYE